MGVDLISLQLETTPRNRCPSRQPHPAPRCLFRVPTQAARPRARTAHNTFVEQLLELSREPKLGHLDHTTLDLRDGGNDPCDDRR